MKKLDGEVITDLVGLLEGVKGVRKMLENSTTFKEHINGPLLNAVLKWMDLYFMVIKESFSTPFDAREKSCDARDLASMQVDAIVEELASTEKITNTDLILMSLVADLKHGHNEFITDFIPGILADSLNHKPKSTRDENGKRRFTITFF